MKKLFILILLACSLHGRGQSYFPPLIGNSWETISPASLGWCQPAIDSLYSFLDKKNTKGFIVLKDGKIVLEKYFGTFTQDSIHYWASGGKSLVAMLTGVAQERGIVNINNTVSSYLGAGWTAAPTAKESVITVRNLLCMTSGLDDKPASPCDNESPEAACLKYLADTGQRWAYHTGAYQKVASVLSAASGMSINGFTNQQISNRIGMTGAWVNGVYFSKTRSMARFGLLSLNKGIWQNDTLIHDANYWNQMLNTSQPYNPAYGYLWWLNGKSSFLAPGLQFVFNGSLIPNAPADMYAALGKNDQKIYVVPSRGLVVIRTGESAYGVALAFSPFDDELWGKLDSLDHFCSYTFNGNGNWSDAANWSNQLKPPATLEKDASIIISPSAGGACFLNVPQTIASGTQLKVAAGAKFTVMGNLTINQ
ncbi:MAG: class C beta-lactamase-related serine hydrolase [Pedobacter sp.]|nr:MAG: class C beta-lactamase-related serine hydrolase [Pedobacter sp.]